MEVSIKWFDGQYPSFNIMLASGPEKQPFLEIKGCKIVNGRDGDFISYPSRKQDNGKYWNHVYGSDAFNAEVLRKAVAAMPHKPSPRARQAAHDDDGPPF